MANFSHFVEMIYRLGHMGVKEGTISDDCIIKNVNFWEILFDRKFIYVKIPCYNIARSNIAW